ncbi:protein kinase [Myxococcota bacterium]
MTAPNSRQPTRACSDPKAQVESLAAQALDSTQASSTGLVGRVLVDRYRVLDLLGVGGMATVYRAEHVHMRKLVALKVLHPEFALQPEVVARFEREAIAAGRIDEPHVVAATDFGRLEDGSFYLALEHVPGTDLAEVLSRGKLDPVRALRIARQIVVALAAAHHVGVIHRDLKPENVMLVDRTDGAEFVKVLDFGIAQVSPHQPHDLQLPGGTLTQIGSVFGTPEYMAPEQAAGRRVDHRADLYTVGIILYEMLEGRAPFLDDDVGRVLRMQLEAPPPPLPAWIPTALTQLVFRLLSKDPAARSQSAVELLEQLDVVLLDIGPVTEDTSPRRAVYGHAESLSSHRAGPEPHRDAWSRVLRIGGWPVPLWVLGVFAVALAVSMLVRVGSLRNPVDLQPSSLSSSRPMVQTATASRSRSVPDESDLPRLLASASLGEEEALRLLSLRPLAGRIPAEWLAIGRGRMAREQTVQALEAYAKALEADPSLGEDRTLLRHVRQAAREDASAETALRIAARRLGSEGADVLYDVWVATRDRTTITQLAKHLVYSPKLRAKASPALNALLELRDAHTCEDYRRLLPTVVLHGDFRAWRILRLLTRKQGCGPDHKEDCYACLRQDDGLDQAIQAVKRRPGPRF